MSLFIISEPGSTHDGKKDQMMQHIVQAKAAGADAIKFQWVSSAEKLAARRHALGYVEAYKLIAFPKSWLGDLFAACHDAGIEFMCTVYLGEDLGAIAGMVQRFKVASFEAMDDVFLRQHTLVAPGIPVLLSTGMMTLEDVALQAAKVGHLGGVLHCVSAYPTPTQEAHLDSIYQMRRMLSPVPVGFSDHTRSITTGGLAVAAGAQILEVHCRLEGTPLNNADYSSALGPNALKEYVDYARKVELMVGYGVKRVQPSEEPMLRFRVKP